MLAETLPPRSPWRKCAKNEFRDTVRDLVSDAGIDVVYGKRF
jgi:hypothetical protein